MRIKQKIILLLLIPFLISCKSQEQGPYKVTKLTQLKYKSEINGDYFKDFHPTLDVYNQNYKWFSILSYDQETKEMNIYRWKLLGHYEEITDDERESISDEEKHIKNYIIDYFLITKDNLSQLFPVEIVSASHVPWTNYHIEIKLYDSLALENHDKYRIFKYRWHEEGFLTLIYTRYMENGEVKNSELRVFSH